MRKKAAPSARTCGGGTFFAERGVEEVFKQIARKTSIEKIKKNEFPPMSPLTYALDLSAAALKQRRFTRRKRCCDKVL